MKVISKKFYQIDSLDDLKSISILDIRWLDVENDFDIFKNHLLDQGYALDKDKWRKWEKENISYCGLIINGVMVARAAVERYSEDKWETADVRVIKSERGKGYGKQLVFFVTKYILESGCSATCYTLSDNIAMQQVALTLGFKEIVKK